jgi:hypothetical protein
MYYLIKGHCPEFIKKMAKDEDFITGGEFEWILEATSPKEAMAQLKQNEVCDEIRVIDVDERIQREQESLINIVRNIYISHNNELSNMPIRQYCTLMRDTEWEKECEYKALVEFNKILRLVKVLKRQETFNTITAKELSELLYKLVSITDEEIFNQYLKEKGFTA